MKTRIFLMSSLVVAVSIATMSCSGASNVNGNNRQSANVANEAPTPNTPTPTPENQEANIRKLMSDLATALMKGDTDALDKIYSDEYILVTDTGQIMSKPERMVMIKSGDLKFDKVDFEEVSVRVYGNSAVAITHAVTTGTFYGKPQSVEDRIIFVAVKDGDAWRFVNAQMTPIAGEPTSGNSKTMSGSNRVPGANSSSGGTSSSSKP